MLLCCNSEAAACMFRAQPAWRVRPLPRLCPPTCCCAPCLPTTTKQLVFDTDARAKTPIVRTIQIAYLDDRVR